MTDPDHIAVVLRRNKLKPIIKSLIFQVLLPLSISFSIIARIPCHAYNWLIELIWVINHLKIVLFLCPHTSPLLLFLLFIVPGQTAEVRDEVAPLVVLLLQIVALQLAVVHKVINQGDTVILTDAMHLIQALVRVERQFFAHLLNFLGLLWEHVPESLLLVLH